MAFKDVVDSLSAIASTIAIVSVLYAWYRSAKKPLKIPRIVVHRNRIQNNSKIIVLFKNSADYPIVIRRCDGYSQRTHQVTKKPGEGARYSEHYSSKNAVFHTTPELEVSARGYARLNVKMNDEYLSVPSPMKLLLETSHGHHELTCKKVSEVEMEKVNTYTLVFDYESKSRFRAKIVYLKELAKKLTGRCS